MTVTDWFRKKPVDRVDGGEIDIAEETEKDSAEKAVESSREELKEREKKERMRRFIARISAVMERVELLERKIDRIESRLGIKDEASKSE